MNNIEDRLRRLEISFGVRGQKEPNTWEEFLEQYPDYEELADYYAGIFNRVREQKNKNHPEPNGFEIAGQETEKELRESPEYLNDKKLQQAIKCSDYYNKLYSGIDLNNVVYGGLDE